MPNWFKKKLTATKIRWVDASEKTDCIFESENNGDKLKLRLNDYPEEALYTLFVKAKGSIVFKEEQSFSDWPKDWEYPIGWLEMAMEKLSSGARKFGVFIFGRVICDVVYNRKIDNCEIVIVEDNEDSGFVACYLSLLLQGNKNADRFNRKGFTKLISDSWDDPKFKVLINEIFRIDAASDLMKWKERFINDKLYLQNAHFRFLSQYFNIKFDFFTFDNGNFRFAPEAGHESIFDNTTTPPEATILLRHEHKMTVDHYDTIVVGPTVTQRDQIDEYFKNPMAFILAFNNTDTPEAGAAAGAGSAVGSFFPKAAELGSSADSLKGTGVASSTDPDQLLSHPAVT